MDVAAWVDSTTSIWSQTKTFIEHAAGVSNDAVHVLAGACAFLLIASIARLSVRDIRPWAIVLVLELLNEWHDLRVEEWPSAAMQWGEGAKDVLLTMALPTIILLLVRIHPALFRQTDENKTSGDG